MIQPAFNQSNNKTFIEYLPPELRLEIYKRIDFHSLIQLSKTSRFFYDDLKTPEMNKAYVSFVGKHLLLTPPSVKERCRELFMQFLTHKLLHSEQLDQLYKHLQKEPALLHVIKALDHRTNRIVEKARLISNGSLQIDEFGPRPTTQNEVKLLQQLIRKEGFSHPFLYLLSGKAYTLQEYRRISFQTHEEALNTLFATTFPNDTCKKIFLIETFQKDKLISQELYTSLFEQLFSHEEQALLPLAAHMQKVSYRSFSLLTDTNLNKSLQKAAMSTPLPRLALFERCKGVSFLIKPFTFSTTSGLSPYAELFCRLLLPFAENVTEEVSLQEGWFRAYRHKFSEFSEVIPEDVESLQEMLQRVFTQMTPAEQRVVRDKTYEASLGLSFIKPLLGSR